MKLNNLKEEKNLKQSLKEQLKKYDKVELDEIYYFITEKETKVGKTKLIDKIYKELTNEDFIKKVLEFIGKNEYELLIKMINNNGYIEKDDINREDYYYLKNIGIIYIYDYNDISYLIIPEEIINIFYKIDVSNYEEKAITNSNLLDLLQSMLHLYGVVPFDLYIKRYCNFYNCSVDNIRNVDLGCIFVKHRNVSIQVIKSKSNTYLVKDEYLYDEDPTEHANINRIIASYEDELFPIDFKNVSLEETLKYKEMYSYLETDATLKFKKFLVRSDIFVEDIDLLIEALVVTFRKSYNEGMLFLNEILEEENVYLNEENIDDILMHIHAIINEIPLWGNKGWSNKEIALKECYEPQE